VAAADDGRRRRGPGFRSGKAGSHPAVEGGLGEQPAAGRLAAWHRAGGDQLVQLALGEPQMGGGLLGGEQLRYMK
jgi:hypothetical protein